MLWGGSSRYGLFPDSGSDFGGPWDHIFLGKSCLIESPFVFGGGPCFRANSDMLVLYGGSRIRVIVVLNLYLGSPIFGNHRMLMQEVLRKTLKTKGSVQTAAILLQTHIVLPFVPVLRKSGSSKTSRGVRF